MKMAHLAILGIGAVVVGAALVLSQKKATASPSVVAPNVILKPGSAPTTAALAATKVANAQRQVDTVKKAHPDVVWSWDGKRLSGTWTEARVKTMVKNPKSSGYYAVYGPGKSTQVVLDLSNQPGVYTQLRL